MESRKKDRLLPNLLIVLECVNLVGVYLILPVRFFGVYTHSKVPYTEPWADEIAQYRYITVLDHPDYFGINRRTADGGLDLQRTSYDVASFLTNNYATYYGFDDLSGYSILNTKESDAANGEFLSLINDIGGSIGDVYDGMVDEMRDRAVSLYITLPENADYVESCLEPYGITRWKEDDNRVIFYDSEAEPRAYCSDASEDFGEVDLDVHVNYLEVTTPDDFEGGSVTVNFIHDRGFIATVDGQEVPITDCGNYSDMIVSDVASGSHKIIFRFVDNSFRYCLIFSSAVTVILAAVILICRKLKNKES